MNKKIISLNKNIINQQFLSSSNTIYKAQEYLSSFTFNVKEDLEPLDFFNIDLINSNVTSAEYGSIKIYEGYDETGVIVTPNEKIRYDENSDLLILDDKITFTDIETGNYQEWSKDSNGSIYQSLESTNDLSISYEMIDGVKVANNIEILSDNVNLDDIANLTTYTKEDLQAFKELPINNRFYDKRKIS